MAEQTGNKVLTPEELAKKEADKKAEKAAKIAKEAQRNSSYNVIKELVDKQQDPKYKAALTYIRPSLYNVVTPRVAGVTPSSIFFKLITDKKTVNESEVFTATKFGRKDCAWQIRNMLKKVAPEARLWINYDAAKGTYTLVGTGANEPAGYTGPKPSTESVTLK